MAFSEGMKRMILKIHIELKGTPRRQNNIEIVEQSWTSHTSKFKFYYRATVINTVDIGTSTGI